MAAAGLVVGEAGPVPDGLRGSLATIAAGDGAAAVEAWRGLGVGDDDDEDGWREILAADGWFMELALNLRAQLPRRWPRSRPRAGSGAS